jgi:hypothetical protein
MNQTKTTKVTTLTIISLIILGITGWLFGKQISTPDTFSGERALLDVEYQLSLGPRTPGSDAHAQTVSWLQQELTDSGWSVEIQETTVGEVEVKNIVAKRGQGTPWIILGAHYDSRIAADQDQDAAKRTERCQELRWGSGVAVLLELARVLPTDLDKQIWLVFFDAEDNGNYNGRGWIIGSQAFVANLEGQPDSAIIVDMIGDADLNIYMEKNSNPALTQEIWGVASELGYVQFAPEYRYRIIDDHVPFIQANIPAVDIIDFDYPYWHTTEDTLDKVSANSLKAVGDTLLAWLQR